MRLVISDSFLNKAMWAVVVLSLGLSACSSEHDAEGETSGEVMAVDRVDEAAKLAIENAPEAEKIEFPAAPVPAATTDDTATVDGMTEDGAAAASTDMAATTDTAATSPEATSTTTTDSAPAANAQSVTATADGAANDSQ